MNLLTDDRINETGVFTSELALFSPSFEFENRGEETPSRLTRDQMDAFLAASDNARSAHFFTAAPEPPATTPEKGLAAGVLKQAAHDLRRFRAATKGVKRELYLDAYTWITANDFSWPYSFVNVCKLLDVSPEVVRTEIFADASWPDVFPENSRPLLFAFSEAAVIRRAPRPTSWLRAFERI